MTTNNGPYKSEGETVDVFDDRVHIDTEPPAEEPKYRDKKWLYYQYHEEGKSPRDIADEYGYGSTTIDEWIDKHDIPKRDMGDAISNGKRMDGPFSDKDWLYTQYVTLERSCEDIGSSLGVSSSTIHRWLIRHGIEPRTTGEASSLQNKRSGPWRSESWLRGEYVDEGKPTTQIAEEQGVSETLINSALHDHGIELRSSGGISPHVAKEKKYPDRDWLYKQYVTRERPGTDIAEECDVSPDTIYYWLDHHGIEVRSRTESRTISFESSLEPIKIDLPEDATDELTHSDTGNRSYSGPSSGIDASWSDIQDRPEKSRVPYKNKEWIQHQYHTEGLNYEEIADMCGVSQSTIGNWMEKHDIPSR